VTLSRKGAKSRRRITGLRSKTTKTRTHVDRVREPRADLKQQLEACRRELAEALEQQAATSEVLGVISRSPGELARVFQAMLENATRICGAKFGILFRYQGGVFHPAAMTNVPPAFADFLDRQGSFAPVRGRLFGRLARTKKVIHVVDRATERTPSPSVRYGGARSSIGVPLVKGKELIGAFFIYRTEVQPFTHKQIELVKSFAAQAVIAIENTRLLNELRQRTNDLSEALEQQTATSEVLQVISSSPGELEPVFQAILANATRLCEASYGLMYLCEGDALRMAALYGDLPRAFKEQWRSGRVFRPHPDVAPARAVRTRKVVHVADLREDRAYLSGDPLPVAGVEVAGIRTLLVIPMLKEDEPVGAISIYRKEVRPFTAKQIELVTNFAAQDTRLLNELRESLKQQTATADVLKVISRSTFDLQTVLDTLVESAARLCEADNAAIHRPQGESWPYVASYGLSREYDDYMRAHPLKPSRGTVLGRTVLERKWCKFPTF
jgi:two-component system, NtrC family, sensor kinase